MKKITLLAVFAFLLAYAAEAQNVGDNVQVLWNGSWYGAAVKEVKDGKWLIHYDGYGAEWDEWVGQDRIRATWKAGDKLQVEWQNQWYPATILEVGNGKYKVHYDGWGAEWDEWVTLSRMKKK
jgi:hypothetical protein